jgi:hypothetical protein
VRENLTDVTTDVIKVPWPRGNMCGIRLREKLIEVTTKPLGVKNLSLQDLERDLSV